MSGSSKTPPQLIAQEFFAAQNITIPQLTDPVTPSLDLAFIRDVNLFFLRRQTPAHHWAPFPITEFAKAPTLHALLLAFIQQNYPSYPFTPQSLTSLAELAVHFCPNLFAVKDGSSTIAFTDNRSFSFTHKTLIPTSPSTDFTLLALPFPSSQLDTSTPLFDSYIAHAFPEDPVGYTTFLYELLGYLLLPAKLAKEPACFYLYGETGSGKSVFLDVIEAIFPSYLKSALSLHELTNNRFSLSTLAGKLLNIVDEDESEYVNGGKLKALTSMRPLSAERKYEQGFTFTPQAKFIFSSNQYPTLKNLDAAIERRLYIIPFEHRVPDDKRDPFLAEKLIANELPGIVGKALVHALRFLDNNLTFSLPTHARAARDAFMVEASSPLAFFEACYKVDPSHQTTNDALYEDYLLYCRKYNRNATSSQKFHTALRRVTGLQTVRISADVRGKNCVKRLDAPLLNV
jgi:P4 family phage/plasmid primase-like protien